MSQKKKKKKKKKNAHKKKHHPSPAKKQTLSPTESPLSIEANTTLKEDLHEEISPSNELKIANKRPSSESPITSDALQIQQEASQLQDDSLPVVEELKNSNETQNLEKTPISTENQLSNQNQNLDKVQSSAEESPLPDKQSEKTPPPSEKTIHPTTDGKAKEESPSLTPITHLATEPQEKIDHLSQTSPSTPPASSVETLSGSNAEKNTEKNSTPIESKIVEKTKPSTSAQNLDGLQNEDEAPIPQTTQNSDEAQPPKTPQKTANETIPQTTSETQESQNPSHAPNSTETQLLEKTTTEKTQTPKHSQTLDETQTPTPTKTPLATDIQKDPDAEEKWTTLLGELAITEEEHSEMEEKRQEEEKKEPLKTLVIIPTYNEKENLPLIIKEIHATVPHVHILIVDDNSPDGTGDIADSIAQEDERVFVLHRSGKLGLGTAYIAGFKYGLERDYQLFQQMDCDFSHRPQALKRFFEAIEDADLVIGSRYITGGSTQNWPLSRKLLSRGGSLYARTILQMPVKDFTGGFKCFRREVLEAIDLDAVRSEGYSFQIEMTWRAHQKGFKIREIPILFADRKYGESKMNKKIFMEAVLMCWKLRLGLVR